MQSPPVEGNFTDDSGHAIKSRVVKDYNAYMGFVDKSDRTVNSYGITRRSWKWTKKVFFHLTDMTILNAFLMHKSSGSKMAHKSFQEVLVRNLIILSRGENMTASGASRGRSSPFASQLTHLEVKYSEHRPSKGKQAVPHVFTEKRNPEHAVLLQQMQRRFVHSELLWEVAYVCEPVNR